MRFRHSSFFVLSFPWHCLARARHGTHPCTFARLATTPVFAITDPISHNPSPGASCAYLRTITSLAPLHQIPPLSNCWDGAFFHVMEITVHPVAEVVVTFSAGGSFGPLDLTHHALCIGGGYHSNGPRETVPGRQLPCDRVSLRSMFDRRPSVPSLSFYLSLASLPHICPYYGRHAGC